MKHIYVVVVWIFFGFVLFSVWFGGSLMKHIFGAPIVRPTISLAMYRVDLSFYCVQVSHRILSKVNVLLPLSNCKRV